jgi:MFS family permease
MPFTCSDSGKKFLRISIIRNTNVIPENKRSSVFGYFGAMLGASAVIGPMIGGLLTEHFGWKAIFLVNLPLLLLSWVLVKSDTPG